MEQYLPHRDVTSMKRESQIKKKNLMSGVHSSVPLYLIYKLPHNSSVIELNKTDGNQPFYSSVN